MSTCTIRRMMCLAIAIVSAAFLPAHAWSDGPKAPAWLTGKNLRQELEQPFSANWSQEELRRMLIPISMNRHISIVLDRRIDCSSELNFGVTNVTLMTGLRQIANMANGDVSLPENFVFVGPTNPTRFLRSLIELRNAELQSKSSGIPDRHRSELLRRRTMSWNDLDTPREILDKIADQRGIRLLNSEIIPHDLWAATVLPDATTSEALSVVLIQFDLTFRWADSGKSIEIISIPEFVSIERKHRPKQTLADAFSLVRQRFPGIDVEMLDAGLIVKGTVEDHESVTDLLGGKVPIRRTKEEPLKPIQQRLFTFSANQPVPIIAVMKKLEESDIRFVYDEQELKSAGIDLEKMIRLDAKNRSADDFFRMIFQSSGIEFQFEQTKVLLKPKHAE